MPRVVCVARDLADRKLRLVLVTPCEATARERLSKLHFEDEQHALGFREIRDLLEGPWGTTG